jgi:hypothetical protein
MSDITEQLLERIRKLLRLAQNNPNEHEAAVALSRAHKLCAQYNLSLTDMEDKPAKEDPYAEHAEDRTRARPWMRTICSSVASLYFCKFYTMRKPGGRGRQFYFVGRTTNVAIARMISEMVLNVIAQEAKRFSPVTSDRNSFRNGAAQRIRERCDALLAEAMRDETKSETGTALVLASVYARERQGVAAYLQQRGVQLIARNTRSRSASNHAFGAGRSAGDRVNLRPSVAASPPRAAITRSRP